MDAVKDKGTFVSSFQTYLSSDGRSFKPLVIMEFPSKAKRAAIEWIISKIEAPKSEGGAELLVDAVDHRHSQGENGSDDENEETMLYIGGGTERLLLGAELMELHKPYTDGYLRELSLKDLENYQGSGDLDTFLTTAEKQKIILHELENMRAVETDVYIPGYEKCKLYPGNSLVRKYLSGNVAKQLFPLHDTTQMKELGSQWYRSFFKEQPIHKIRAYFGETIGLYFAFLGVYTWALIPPALIGAIYFITSWDNAYRDAIFATFNLVWATVFLETWKRYCNELTFRWGTINTVRSEEPRASYHGQIGRNPVTGKPELKYPKWKRVVRFYCVSLPVVSVCLYMVFIVMLMYFWCQEWVEKKYKKEGGGAINYVNLYMPTVGYAIVIGIMNTIYRKIAKFLNDWENHRLQSAYDNHLIFKLVVFDFINCFVSLFYVAFYMRDMALLRSFLATLLITQQIIGQIREAVVPFIFFRRRAKHMQESMDASNGEIKKDEKDQPENGAVDLTIQKQANVESTMDVYDGTLDDYLEMFLQFGYVFLFSSAFPMAAFWALLNNVTEIRTDSFKMCRVFQRPFAQSAAGIGAWQVAFEVISVLAVITNTALIAMSPGVRKLLPDDLSIIDLVLLFVAVEHLILGLKAFLAYVIPDVPKWVQLELARMDHRSKMALHNERISEAAKRKGGKTK